MDDYGTKVAVTLDSIREGRVYGNISLALGLYSLDEVRSAVSDGLVIVASEKSKFSDYFAELVLSWKSEIIDPWQLSRRLSSICPP